MAPSLSKTRRNTPVFSPFLYSDRLLFYLIFVGFAIKSDPVEVAEDSEMEKVEKKFTNLKTSIVEKCQSSKM